MSDDRYPTAPTVSPQGESVPQAESGNPSLRTTAAESAPAASAHSDYAAHRTAVSGLRVERDPSITPDSAEFAMAQLRAAGIGISSNGLTPKLAAQRDARMAEHANYSTHPELSTSTPMQEQAQDAPAPIRPASQKPVAGRPVQNLKGAKAQPKPVVGRWTQQLATALRIKQTQPTKTPTR